jgi:hypothetical protein
VIAEKEVQELQDMLKLNQKAWLAIARWKGERWWPWLEADRAVSIGIRADSPYGASVGHWNADPRSVAWTAGTGWVSILAFFKYRPAEVCQNVSKQHRLFIRRSHEDQVSEHLCYICCDFREVGFFALVVALQHFKDVAMQAVRHANSFGPGETLRHLFGQVMASAALGSGNKRHSCPPITNQR